MQSLQVLEMVTKVSEHFFKSIEMIHEDIKNLDLSAYLNCTGGILYFNTWGLNVWSIRVFSKR